MKKKKVLAVAIALSVALVLAVTPAMAATNVVLCRVDIGDTTSEAGHSLVGWGPIEPITHGGNWGGFNTTGEDCRVIWSTCPPDDGGKRASIILDRCVRPGAAKAIRVRHLDGIADDSFDVSVRDVDGTLVLIGSWAGSPGSENWVTTEFPLPNGKTLQLDRGRAIEVVLEATGPPWTGQPTYGQVAFDWIELIGNGKK